ncbi:XPG N-terminal domain-containing protein [Toxoplasma gondii TgCatPRC2]|uniref:Exonuclease 1 n=1 Tax=Toxoplasma gondii TgCatPRC2 TaxID=1130821 RepID=A0A151H2F9_TOXGO|nr:XPG N-terminal domain-containing protein [Toxoplasma gondii TgCatPRC2]
MGIQNLLKFLKPLAQPAHISEFAGQTVGVDAMSWLHRGAIACAVELIKQEESDKFLRFVIHMIMLFKYHRVEPLLVFDGAKIPAKAAEDEKRQQARQKASEEARELLKKYEEARRAGRKPPGDTRVRLWFFHFSVSCISPFLFLLPLPRLPQPLHLVLLCPTVVLSLAELVVANSPAAATFRSSIDVACTCLRSPS